MTYEFSNSASGLSLLPEYRLLDKLGGEALCRPAPFPHSCRCPLPAGSRWPSWRHREMRLTPASPGLPSDSPEHEALSGSELVPLSGAVTRLRARSSKSLQSLSAACSSVSSVSFCLPSMPTQKHGANRSMSREFQKQERELSTVENASAYVKRMVEHEARGWGDQSNAQRRLEVKYGLPFWPIEHLRTGRAKSVEAGLFQRIRAAYLDLCERQVAKLQHEIAIEKAIHDDDSMEDLVREAETLLVRIAEKRNTLR